MRKFGLLVTSPVGIDKNIGDYIQSLAALQFLPTNERFDYIEKEDIANYKSESKTKSIMNAWYIWHPENWPPKEESIDPLLTSIHICPLTADAMLADGGREYFIKHGPIGCRDTGTLEFLRRNNVPAFFSGCLTLTLGKRYKFNETRKGIVFVDPYFPPIRYVNDNETIYYPLNLLNAFRYFLTNPKKILRLSKKSFFKGRLWIQTIYNASMFYNAYSKYFTDDLIFGAEYLSHMVPVGTEDSQESFLLRAESFVNKYAQSKLVITSRIHCALPCLGLETPVIFVLDKMMESEKNIFNTPGRFGGLIDFFRVVAYSNDEIKPIDEELKKKNKIDSNFTMLNKTNWEKYRDKLIEQCEIFINRK